MHTYVDSGDREKLLRGIASVINTSPSGSFKGYAENVLLTLQHNDDDHFVRFNNRSKSLYVLFNFNSSHGAGIKGSSFSDYLIKIMKDYHPPKMANLLEQKVIKNLEQKNEKEGKSMKSDKEIINVQVPEARIRFESCLRNALWTKGKPNAVLATVAQHIIDDTKEHYVACSSDEANKISYAKYISQKNIREKRIKTTLSKYIKRHYRNLYDSIGAQSILTFENDFNVYHQDIIEGLKDTHTDYGSNNEMARKIDVDRAALIKTMKSVNDSFGWTDENNKHIIELVMNHIMNDTNHYLSLSADNADMVSYAKNHIVRFDNNKRTKLTLSRYIEKYCLPKMGISINKIHLKTFSDNVVETLNRNNNAKRMKLIKEAIKKAETVEINRINEVMPPSKYKNKEDIYIPLQKPKNVSVDVTSDSDEIHKAEAVEILKKYKAEYNLEKDRRELLKTMSVIASNAKNTFLEGIVEYIIDDKQEHFLSLSKDVRGQISYAKTKEAKFDDEKRTRSTLAKYIKRNLPHIMGEDYKLTFVEWSTILKFSENVETEIAKQYGFEHQGTTSVPDVEVVAQDRTEKTPIQTISTTVGDIEITKKEYPDKSTLITHTENGTIKKTITYKGPKTSIETKISEIVYFSNGNIQEENYYNNGELNRRVVYYINGSIKTMSHYDKGKLNNIKGNNVDYPDNAVTHYDDQGLFLEKASYANGVITKKINYNNHYRTETLYNVNQDPISLAKYYDNHLQSVSYYKKGFRYKLEQFINEAICQISVYNEDGSSRDLYFYKSGRISKEIHFDENNLLHRADGDLPAIMWFEDNDSHKQTITEYHIHGKKLAVDEAKLDEGIKKVKEWISVTDTPQVVNDMIYKPDITEPDENEIHTGHHIGMQLPNDRDENKKENEKGNGLISGTVKCGIGIQDDEKINFACEPSSIGANEMGHPFKAQLPEDNNEGKDEVIENTDYPLTKDLLETLKGKHKSVSIGTAIADNMFTNKEMKGFTIANPAPELEVMEPTKMQLFKNEAKGATYRVAANQMSKGVRNAIVALMKSNGMDNTKLQYVQEVLDSEIGLAIISTMMGFTLTYSKYNEDARVQKIAKEFRTEGMATAGNAVVDEAIQYIAPIIKQAVDAMPQDEKFRVEEKKEEINQDEMVEMIGNDNHNQIEVL